MLENATRQILSYLLVIRVHKNPLNLEKWASDI